MGRFIEIAIDRASLNARQAAAVVRACPVDIFTLDETKGLRTDPAVEDECILCGACVTAAGSAVEVRRAYGARTLVSPAGGSDG
jgi:NAD-dependent dihydropyrimidine dehydrogenase PreA subunit